MKKHLRRLLIFPFTFMLVIPIIMAIAYYFMLIHLREPLRFALWYQILFNIFTMAALPCWLTLVDYPNALLNTAQDIKELGFSMLLQDEWFTEHLLPELIIGTVLLILPLISILLLKKTSIFYRIFLILPLLLMIFIDVFVDVVDVLGGIGYIITVKDVIYLLIAVIVDILYTIERRKNRL